MIGVRREGRARAWMVAGAFLYPPLVAVLLIAGVPTLDGLFTAFLLAVLPALGAAQGLLVPDGPLPRIPVYASSAATIALLGACAGGLGLRLGGASGLGLVPLPAGLLAAWSAGLLATALLVVVTSLSLGRRLGAPESGLVAALLPKTLEEKVAFAGLSLLAGLGEELAYRGYLVAVLAALVGPWGAVAVGAVAFSLLHGYQGWVGVARTALLGALLGASLVKTGSLWPAVAAHAALDLVLGLLLGERLLAPEEGSR